jgi:hypothetical protein
MANPNEGVFDADPEMITLSRKLTEARDNRKQWDEICDGTRDQILARVDEIAKENGDADVKALTAGGIKVVSITENIRKTYDTERLKVDHPEIDFTQYEKVSFSRTVRPGRF